MTYEVVVVGGGIGGLTAAALLAARGVSVCLLERASRVGGCAANFEHLDHVFEGGRRTLRLLATRRPARASLRRAARRARPSRARPRPPTPCDCPTALTCASAARPKSSTRRSATPSPSAPTRLYASTARLPRSADALHNAARAHARARRSLKAPTSQARGHRASPRPTHPLCARTTRRPDTSAEPPSASVAS